jgi:hypothetical protein
MPLGQLQRFPSGTARCPKSRRTCLVRMTETLADPIILATDQDFEFTVATAAKQGAWMGV